MELTQTNDTIVIHNRDASAFILPLCGSLLGLLIVLSWAASLLSKTDILNVNPLTGVIGLFFLIGCTVIAYGADDRTTELTRSGPCEVVTKRRISGRTFEQTFAREDVARIEFVHGFDEKSWGNVKRSSSIYIVLKNSDKIEVLMRRAIPFSFPIKQNQPPTQEADLIAHFLNVPLETIDITTLKAVIRNFDKAVTPALHDRARILSQPPEELDKKNKIK